MITFLFIVAAISLFLLLIALEQAINRLLGVEKKQISTTPGKQIDRWGRIIFCVLFLCTLPFMMTKGANSIEWYWIIYFVLLFGFQAILEWRYLKNSKQYVTTLIFLTLGVIVMLCIAYVI
ncbi:DUF4181 domain-containing protein [Bacillus badius]|uniref:DUF4181 domain-containing protein n=1 Tax=Bacillus badius TaxID=1455 RepID=A0ABR5AQN6_BACBA|nr:DUF4181 domain-containing protein [Bacillus badius]KIL77065.1 hypothetical protein SD77_1817 [Bacillus badius]MED4717859.1 DUF4181 domain-containing protein [Bacillus badius]